MKVRSLFLVCMLLMLWTAVAAQSPSKILKQAEKALGGAKPLRNTMAWRKSGTITRVSDGAVGKIVMQTARPNLYNLRFDVGGFEIESGFNGKSGWIRDSREGLRTLVGEASTHFQAEAAYRNSLWLDAKKERSRITSGGKAEVGGKPANVLNLTTVKGASIKVFFDPSTNLPVREEFSNGKATRNFEYSDYRVVGGVAQPHRVRMELDGVAYDVVFEQVNSNPQISKTEFDFPRLSGDPLPDIPTLLEEVQANEEKVERMLDSYSYVQKFIRRELGKDGVLQEKSSTTVQMSFHKGFRMARLIEKDGKPLSPSEQAEEDKRAGKQVEEIERKIAKRESREAGSQNEEQRVSIAELLRASSLVNPRRERFRDRDVIVFDFEPNPNFDYKNAKSMLKFFGKTAGSMWIDEKDKQVARLEAFLFDSYKIAGGMLATLKKGASFTLEQERVNDEIWLPSTADINLSVRVFMVKGIDLNQVIRSYDYRKFTTEVKDAKVDSVKQQ